jgi:hypothetical protein
MRGIERAGWLGAFAFAFELNTSVLLLLRARGRAHAARRAENLLLLRAALWACDNGLWSVGAQSSGKRARLWNKNTFITTLLWQDKNTHGAILNRLLKHNYYIHAAA